MVQKNVCSLKKNYEKKAGRVIDSFSEGEDKDAVWRRVWRIFGQDDFVFNRNQASRISISGYGNNLKLFENNILNSMYY